MITIGGVVIRKMTMKGEPSKPRVNEIWQTFLKHNCKKILDVGCGAGWLGAHKPDKTIKVFGVDSDETRIRIARKYEVVVTGDIRNLPYRDVSFDGILASHVLEHVYEDTKAMEELYRILRKGGILIAEAPTPWHGAQVDPTHIRSYTIESFSNLARSVGFNVIRCNLLGRGIPGFGKLKLHYISYHLGKFLANRLGCLKGFVFMVCKK